MTAGTYLASSNDDTGVLAWLEERIAAATLLPAHYGEVSSPAGEDQLFCYCMSHASCSIHSQLQAVMRLHGAWSRGCLRGIMV